MTQAIKFCSRPVVAAPFGMCLGGGAEVSLHAAARQSHTELYIGLVETGVGLVPGGGGCKEMLLRAIDTAAQVRDSGRNESVELMEKPPPCFRKTSPWPKSPPPPPKPAIWATWHQAIKSP